MNRFATLSPIVFLLSMAVALTMPSVSAAQQPLAAATEADRLSRILKNMPVNSDKRCVGIAGVAEALLGGKQTAEEPREGDADRLAEQIFAAFRGGRPVEYPSRILVDGRPLPITHRDALTLLSTRVADVYKARHKRAARSEEGIDNLIAAEFDRVMTLAELDELLAADADQIDFYCCFGRRWFPDGTTKETSHAVLLRRKADGPPTVYDPNDPGTPQQAKFAQTDQGLEVEWTCPYRDTGMVTTQRYHLVPKQRYFQAAFERAAADAEVPAGDQPPVRP